jgi:integrase
MAEKNSRRPARVLTARLVETVATPGKYFDGHGLFLRVRPNGSRAWVQRIVIRGKRCELGLGAPPAVSLATARKLALENRGKAVLGADPLQERREAFGELTFEQAAEKYLAAKLDGFRNAKHRQQWRSTLHTYAKPILGGKLVSHVTTRDVLRVLEPIWAGKTNTASRLRGRIEAILSWSTVAGHRSGDNPARWKGNLAEMLPKPGKLAKGDNQPALALHDAARWWDGLARREGIAARALQFLVLTAARSGEVRGMTWDELDYGGADKTDKTDKTPVAWVVPAPRMKMGREHRVPLTAEAVAILRSLPRLDGSPYVFPAPRGGMLSDMTLSAVMRRMHESETKAGGEGYRDPRSKRPAVPHGLRSTFRQWAAERGFDRDMAELALAHIVAGDVERAYQRSDMLERRRAMMADWAAFLRGGDKGATVLRFNTGGA